VVFVALRKYDKGQVTIDLWDPLKVLPRDHVVFKVEKVVEELDFSEVNGKYQGTPGNPAYDRKMLLFLVLMGAVDGIFSSRRLGKFVERDLVYMYVTGCSTPDFRTIANFKRECASLIKEAFRKTAEFGVNENISELRFIGIDGTLIKAHASKKSRMKLSEIDLAEKLIEKGIQVDKNEDILYNEETEEVIIQQKETNTKSEEKSFKRVKSSVKKCVMNAEENKEKTLENLDKAKKIASERNKDIISVTDPESFWLPNKQHYFQQLHNLQIAMDCNRGIILDNKITLEPSDHHQLIPMTEEIKPTKNEFKCNTWFLYDNGYYNGDNLKYLEDNEINALIPNKTQASMNKNKGKEIDKFSKHFFTYDFENDLYICPNNEKLEFKSTGKDGRKLYYTNACKNCNDHDKCVKNGNWKIITGYKAEQQMQKMKLLVESPEGQKFYKKRSIAELGFAHMRYNLKFNHFYVTGVENAQIQADLTCFAHNIQINKGLKKQIKQHNQRTHQFYN
jgi:transposase